MWLEESTMVQTEITVADQIDCTRHPRDRKPDMERDPEVRLGTRLQQLDSRLSPTEAPCLMALTGITENLPCIEPTGAS
jgi:hypothetical protein